jgi:uncharacterized protein
VTPVFIVSDSLSKSSNIANEFVRDPNEHLHIGQHVMVKVLNVDSLRKRIQFSMKDV